MLLQLVALVHAAFASPRKPAVLFCSPQGADGGWVDLEYLKNLSAVEGINGDLTTDWALSPPNMNLTWSRLRQYNALVLFGEPAGIIGSTSANETAVPAGQGPEFPALVQRFIAAGGGVLMMPTERNTYIQQFPTLTEALGAILPLEQIVEVDPMKRSQLPRMPGHTGGDVAHTSAVAQGHPVTAGVRGLWYPTSASFNGQMTGALIVDERNWTALIRGSPSSHTVPLNLSAWASSADPNPLPPHPYQRKMNVSSPALFAVRQVGAGRAALLSQFRQFTIGSGSRWLYDDVILSRGLNGLPSDQARLLANTYRWLSEPSLGSEALGGWTPGPGTYAWPNDKPANVDQYVDINNSALYTPGALAIDPINPLIKTFRGMIGAKTALSGGQGTYDDWAAAAKAARLDFLVFLEDFEVAFARNQTNFQHMLSQCSAYSTPELLLLPGYRLKNNLASGKFELAKGNDMLFFGPELSLPPPQALTADGTKLLLMPFVPNSTTLYQGSNGFSYNWLLNGQNAYNAKGDFPWTAGYFNLNDRSSPGGMSMVDLRDEGAAAVRFYAADGSQQNLLEDFLLTAESTMSSVPLAVSEVFSPAALTAAVSSGHALNYLRLSSLDQVMNGAPGGRGLRWNSQYSGTSTFVSDGPLINTYSTPAQVSNHNTNEHRVMTLGSERFVTGVAVQPVSISVNSSAPLRHATIYSGLDKIFFRIRPNATDDPHHIGLTLLLNGVLQKSLTLVVVDELNRTAVSFPFRSIKAGTRAPEFCSDHTNSPAMAKGPTTLPVASYTTALPDQVAGVTWDGGPSSIGVRLELLHLAETRPTLVSSAGTQLASYFTQTPRLEVSDEGSMAITSIQDRVISQVVVAPTNEWNTFGPIDGLAQLFNCTRRSIEWFAASIGHAHVGALSAWAIDDGMVANVIQSDVTFRQSQTVHSLTLMSGALPPDGGPVELVYAVNSSAAAATLNLSALNPGQSRNITMGAGAWFGLISTGSPAAGHLYIVSGNDVRLEVSAPTGDWFRVMAPIEEKRVLPGDHYRLELFAAGLAVNMGLSKPSELLAIRNYLVSPVGLQVMRGQRVHPELGVLRILPDMHSAVVTVPRPPAKALPATAAVGIILPLVVPLQRNWTAGLWQLEGYSLGWYQSNMETNVNTSTHGGDKATVITAAPRAAASAERCLYTALGLDDFGEAHVPLFVGRASRTHVVVGHPVIAQALDGSSEGALNSLRIQVTHVNELPHVWYVAVNNPTDEPITAVLSQNMDLPGLQLSTQRLVLAPGEYRVLSSSG